MGKLKIFNNFSGGLNTNTSDAIGDKDLVVANNVFYNPAGQIQTRRGYRTFGSQIGSNPITSYFFFQRDDSGSKIALCSSGGSMYALTAGTRNSIASNLMEYETYPGKTTHRTRRDYTVYKNVVYMCDGVNPYCKYGANTYAQIGVSAGVVATADNTTDLFTKVAHGLSVNDELYITAGTTMPTGLTAYQVYYVSTVPSADTFSVSNTPNGTAINFTSNGTGTLTYYKLTEPRTRYMSLNQGVCFSAGEDLNPLKLYISDGLSSLSDLNNINQSFENIGQGEEGAINGLGEYAQGTVVLKTAKVHYVSVLTGTTVKNPIDTQSGGYSDRSINSVGNSLVYFNERGIDSLVKRTGVDGAGALESQALSSKIRELIDNIQTVSYNSSCAQYVKEVNNYHFMFDSNGDDVPDTMIVYSSLTGGRSTYNFPEIYDFGTYIDDNGNKQYLFASANGGQMFEYEYGFDDNGSAIEATVQTKNYDFGEGMFEYIELEGRKEDGDNITVTPIIDQEESKDALVENSDLNITNSISLGVSPLATVVVGGEGTESLELFRFKVKLPLMIRGSTIGVKLNSEGVQRILEKVTVNHNGESTDVFAFNSIK